MNKETAALILEAQKMVRAAAAAQDKGIFERGVDKALYRIDQDLRDLLGDEDEMSSNGYPGPGWHRE